MAWLKILRTITWTLISQLGTARICCTHSVWPPCDAQCRGVEPALSSPLTDICHTFNRSVMCLTSLLFLGTASCWSSILQASCPSLSRTITSDKWQVTLCHPTAVRQAGCTLLSSIYFTFLLTYQTKSVKVLKETQSINPTKFGHQISFFLDPPTDSEGRDTTM